MKTRTAGCPIGFRRGGGAWQQDLTALIAWTKANDLSAIDLKKDGDTTVQPVLDAGLRIGSVDLPEWNAMMSPDAGRRAAAIAQNAEYVRACGPQNYFLVMTPEDPALPRAENFGYMVESFGELAPILEEVGGHLAVEGWPGPGALCCTPEGYRGLFREVPSQAMGINYDPSHLIRQGIDPIRFLNEFVGRVVHVHGKDAELLSENLYEFGHEQPPTFAKKFAYGAVAWRYTIPGHGCMRWGKALQILEANGYGGCICIELEDASFNGATETEKLGILQGARFLTGC